MNRTCNCISTQLSLIHMSVFLFIDKLHAHLVGLEPMVLPSTPFLWRKRGAILARAHFPIHSSNKIQMSVNILLASLS